MITQLQEKYRPNFASLTGEEATLVWNCIRKRWPDDAGKEPDDGTSDLGDGECLFDLCQHCGLDQARVVLSLANLNGAARPIIEKLVGRPITPWAATVEAAQKAAEEAGTLRKGWHRNRGRAPTSGASGALQRPLPTPAKVDLRVVVSVAPNPRKEGSDMSVSYRAWRVGDTVQQCRDRGLTARSLRRDTRQKYVVLGPPRAAETQ